MLAGPSPAREPRPRLLVGLQSQCLDQVRAALEEEPDRAAVPLFDFYVDPPLCLAARLGCDASVLRLLLQQSADSSAVDVRGRTPLTLLALRPYMRKPPPGRVVKTPYQEPGPLELAKGLEAVSACLACGADPLAADAIGLLPATAAEAFGNIALARLLRHYRDVQACALLRRVCRYRRGKSGPAASLWGRLPADVLEVVCASLVPERIRCRSGAILYSQLDFGS